MSSLDIEYIDETSDFDSRCSYREDIKSDKCEGRESIVLSVVLYVVVHVSRVTMVFDGSTFTEGGSETRMALKGGGWTEATK